MQAGVRPRSYTGAVLQRLVPLLAVPLLPWMAGIQSDVAALQGIWRGESKCVSNRLPACVDEQVVYYLTAAAEKPDIVTIRADKVVNGAPVTMGVSDWTFDQENQTLKWMRPEQTWLLQIRKDAMEGTLTLADHTVVRRVTLHRSR